MVKLIIFIIMCTSVIMLIGSLVMLICSIFGSDEYKEFKKGFRQMVYINTVVALINVLLLVLLTYIKIEVNNTFLVFAFPMLPLTIAFLAVEIGERKFYKNEYYKNNKNEKENSVLSEEENNDIGNSTNLTSKVFEENKIKIKEKIDIIKNIYGDKLDKEEVHLLDNTIINKIESIENELYKEELDEEVIKMFEDIDLYLEEMINNKETLKDEIIKAKANNVSELFKIK